MFQASTALQTQSADVCSMDPTADTRGPQASRHSHLASFSVEHTFDIVNVSRMVVCPRLLLPLR